MSNLRQTESTSSRYLFYVGWLALAVGVGVSLLQALLPLLQLAVPLVVGGWFWQRHRHQRRDQQQVLDSLFYDLLQTHQGRVTVLDFALTARIPAIAAQRYLDQQAREFAAQFEVSDQGDVIYLFPTLYRTREMKEPHRDNQSLTGASSRLTQVELARRLVVSPQTLSRKKMSPDFTTWTRQKDPLGQGWAYSALEKRFYPVDLGEL